jgi:hypothetical protein
MVEHYGLTVEEQFVLGFSLAAMAEAFGGSEDAGDKSFIPPASLDDLFVKLGWEERRDAALDVLTADLGWYVEEHSR